MTAISTSLQHSDNARGFLSPSPRESRRTKRGIRAGLALTIAAAGLAGASRALAADRDATDDGVAAKLAEAERVAAPPKVLVDGEDWDSRTGVDTFAAPANFKPVVDTAGALKAVQGADFATLLAGGDAPVVELREVAFHVYPDSAGTEPQVMWVIKVPNAEAAPVLGGGPQAADTSPQSVAPVKGPCEWRLYVSAVTASISDAYQTCGTA